MLHTIADNDYTGQLIPLSSFSDLLPLGNKPLKDLCKEYDNLLVFPSSLEETDDKLGADPIFSYNFSNDLAQVNIMTSNVMGFVGKGKQRLRIYSRFDEKDHDYLLHYMMQKVFSINMFDLENTITSSSIFDLLLFFFPYYLKRAMRQGIYRKYTSYQHNDTNIKGAVDISRHIRHNIPFTGKIAYNTREYSRDNAMTQLIRHAIEYIRSSQYSDIILNSDKDTKDFVAEIIESTPSYSRNDRQKVILRNLRVASHPYYSEYPALQEICLRILRNEEIMYEDSYDNFYGILFDGAWLWEEYCNTILNKYGFVHPENKNGYNPLWLFTNKTGKRYPDFYNENSVIDAKYKRYVGKSVSDVGREDLHQIITYMYIRRASYGAFLSPFADHVADIANSELYGYGGNISLLGIEIPTESDSYCCFCEKMINNENKFAIDLENFLSNTIK